MCICYNEGMKQHIITLIAVLFTCAAVSNAQMVKIPVAKLDMHVAPHARGVVGLVRGTPLGVTQFSQRVSAAVQRRVAVPTVTPVTTYSNLLDHSTYHFYDVNKDKWMLHRPDGKEIPLASKPFPSVLKLRADVIREHVAKHGAASLIPDVPVEWGDKAWETYVPVQTRHFTTVEEGMRGREYDVKVPNGKGGYNTYHRAADGTISLVHP